MSKVLIEGASTGIGSLACDLAIERGHEVRAFSRSASSMCAEHPKLEKLDGNALDANDVEEALRDVDVVIQSLGVRMGRNTVCGPVRLFSKATEILLTAMKKQGAQRLITVTGFGAGKSKSRIGCLGRVPFEAVLGTAYRDKDLQETLIKESGLEWVIARPTFLINGPSTNRYKILIDPQRWRNGIVSRKDVADFLVKQVDSDEFLGTAPVITY